MVCPDTALATKPNFSRFVFYKLLTAIPVSAALIAMIRYSGAFYWPVAYVALCLLHAGVMNAIKCPHCPYYKMEGKRYRCFIWWGAPKLYKPRPGPEKRYVAIYAPIGMLILTLFPIYWLWIQWELLLFYLLGVVVLVQSIGMSECTRCLNFDCGHNTVPEDVRREYRESAA